MISKSITQERLKELLKYDSETGVFTRAINSGKNNRWKKGSVVGCVSKKNGYINVSLLGKRYYAHRLAWLYVHGEFPKFDIDHINHVRDDNRIANLRSVTRQENMRNSSTPSHNTSGLIGVSWRKDKRKWRSYITVNGKLISLGSHTHLESAITARKSAEIKYEFHKNHGA